MAVYGRWPECRTQVRQQLGFQQAFDFLGAVVEGRHEAAGWLAALPEGETRRVDLDGDRLYALLQHACTKRHADQQMEAHRRYADVQVVIAGDERLGLAPLQDLRVTVPYDPALEVELYAMPDDAGSVTLRAGDCAVLFPSDGHAPLQAPNDKTAPSRRIVVKVLL